MSKALKILLTVLAVLVIIFVFFGRSSVKLGGSEYAVPFNSMATSSAITVTTADTLVQATTSRSYMVIVNDSSSVIYLSLNSDKAAVANSGIRLNSGGGSYELNAADGNLYSGAIRAIAVGANGVLTVTQR